MSVHSAGSMFPSMLKCASAGLACTPCTRHSILSGNQAQYCWTWQMQHIGVACTVPLLLVQLESILMTHMRGTSFCSRL